MFQAKMISTTLGDELRALWSELREETPTIEQCPPEPAPMRSFGQEAFHQTKNLKKHDANVVIGPIFVQMANGLEINRVEEYSIYLVYQPKRKQSHSTNSKPATRLQVGFMP